ncbi:MAG: signal peptidase I [Candidatus Omnitrophota bacterium]
MRDFNGSGDKIGNVENSTKQKLIIVQVKGKSMHPALQNGDMFVARHTETNKIIPGDIIIYQNIFGDRIVHRVIEKGIKEGKIIFLIKGDNSCLASEYVYAGQILGRGIFIKRMGQDIRIDSGPERLKIAQAKHSAFCGIKYIFRHQLLGGLIRALQGLKMYRSLVMRLIKTSRVSYRAATPSDALSLEYFYRRYYWPVRAKIVNEISEASFYAGRFCFLAQRQDKIIGCVFIQRRSNGLRADGKWQIYGFFMDWRFRSIGIENELLKLAIAEVEKSGINPVTILVPKKDAFAVHFFRNLCGAAVFSEIDPGIKIFIWDLSQKKI